MAKPILALDFDGVIHSYEKGWQDGEIYGKPTPGFFAWAAEAKIYFTLVVFSSRSHSHKGIAPMRDWMAVNLWDHQCELTEQGKPKLNLEIEDFDFPTHKPKAFLTIDDRALTFRGNWSELPPAGLRDFTPWNNPPERKREKAFEEVKGP